MMISDGEGPWPRPLGFWMWVRAGVAVREEDEFLVEERECRVK